MKHVSHIPKWFVANCSSMLSLESMKGHAMTPALFLTIQINRLENITTIGFPLMIMIKTGT